MTEQDRSAPLSVEQQAEFLQRCTDRQNKGEHGKPLYGGPCSQRVERCIHCVIEQAIEDRSVAHAEGVRTGRRQALEEAAAEIDKRTIDLAWCDLSEWLRERATRRDEAHAERTQR